MTTDNFDPETFEVIQPYLNAPDPEAKKELREMRADASLLISQQVENFCREIVLHGRLPTKAYELSFAVEDIELDKWVKPDDASWQASKLLRLPEVIARIKEIRDEVVQWGGQVDRAEVIANLRSIAFDPHAKHTDRLAASKQLATMEAMERGTELPSAGGITIVLPFNPNQLKTIGSGDSGLVIEGDKS